MTAAPSAAVIGKLLRLEAPTDCDLLTSSRDGVRIERLVASSPDRTIYHSPSYFEFARSEGSFGELVALTKSGELLFALPVFPDSVATFQTGYNGILFPAITGERQLRRSVESLLTFFAANSHLRQLRSIQAAVSRGARDPERRALIDYLYSTLAPPGAVAPLFTRVIPLAAAPEELPRNAGEGRLAAAAFDRELLKTYDGDIRNQIRQAEKAGLTVRWFLIAEPGAVELRKAAYDLYSPVHDESWRRTGLTPHNRDYWDRLSSAVTGAGGLDLVVVALDGERPVAIVTSHLFQEQAIYWSGSSNADGLKKRANPLCLHATISLCRRLGVRWFEVGRFSPRQSEKVERITNYKSQFGGSVIRMSNLQLDRRTPRTMVTDIGSRLLHRYSPRTLATLRGLR